MIWLALVVTFGALWLFWLWLGALFDRIDNYFWKHAVAESSDEDSQTRKGTVN